MITSIRIVGVGTQRLDYLTEPLAEGLFTLGYDVRLSTVASLDRRLGSIHQDLRFGEGILSPRIALGTADMLISFEKAETLRSLRYVKRGGLIVTDEHEIYPPPAMVSQSVYPTASLEKLLPKHFDCAYTRAAEVAALLGDVDAQAAVLLGRAIFFLQLERTVFSEALKRFAPAGACEIFRTAFDSGFNMPRREVR